MGGKGLEGAEGEGVKGGEGEQIDGGERRENWEVKEVKGKKSSPSPLHSFLPWPRGLCWWQCLEAPPHRAAWGTLSHVHVEELDHQGEREAPFHLQESAADSSEYKNIKIMATSSLALVGMCLPQ